MTSEELKKLKEEQNNSFSISNIGSILKNIGSDVLTGIGKVLPQTDDRPVFNVVPVKEKLDTINQYNTLEQELKSTQEKYKDFDPIEQDFETFQKTFYPKKEKDLTANIADTLTELQTPVVTKTTAEVKSPFKAPTVATTKQILSPIQEEQKEPEYYDLQASPTEPNLAYQQALEKAEKGALLSGLLQASSKIGRAIAGEGRLPESTDTFEEVAKAYGADKRTLDEIAKRVEVDERLEQSNPKSNLSKIAQEEFKQLLKLEGKEIKDLTALSNLSAKDLAPQINLAKQRQQLMADKAKAEQDKLARAEDLKYRYAALEAQKEMTKEAATARKEAAKLAKEQRKEDKELERDIKTDEKVNEFITKRSDRLQKYREDLKKIEPNLKNLESMLAQDVNSVEQINAIYDFIKRLDNTAVREGEIKLFGAGQSVFDDFEVLKSKLTKNPKVISTAQFTKLFDRLKQATQASRDFYKDELEKSKLEFENRAQKLIEKDPTYRDRLNALDPNYFQQNQEIKAPSSTTLDLINKRSEEENKKRLEELKAKYRGTNR